MRGRTLLSATLFSAVIAALALAQTTSMPPTGAGNSETAAPAPMTGESLPAKSPETNPESVQGAGGGPGNTEAPAPGPGGNATSASPAPETAKEHATSEQAGKKPVKPGEATRETHTHRHVTHPPSSATKHARNISRPQPSPPISSHTSTSVDENASADQELRDAQTALSRHRTDEAQEAL